MANNKNLKFVESEIRKIFFETFNIKEMKVNSLLGTKPDVIGKKGKDLFIGEITVSGFSGYQNKNFHIGATRKLADSFMKLFILQSEKVLIEKELSLEINNINICFIYPEESKFMQALGWREKIFELDILQKYPIAIKPEIRKLILEDLTVARQEVGKK